MARLSSGQQWEDFLRRQQEAANRDLEAQRAAAHRDMEAQVRGLQTLSSASAALPDRARQRVQDTGPNFRERREDMPELEAQITPPPQYRQLAPLTPPASDNDTSKANSSAQIRQLQKEVAYKESIIRRFESEVEVEKDKRRRLRAERHEAVDAQRRAEDGFGRLKRKVANLDELLNESIKREKELECELDNARQTIVELKRQLFEEQCRFESDIGAKKLRERQIMQQLEDTHCALGDEVGRNERSTRDVGPTSRTETQCKEAPQHGVVERFEDKLTPLSADEPSRSRRSDRSTSGRTCISKPRGGKLIPVYMFT